MRQTCLDIILLMNQINSYCYSINSHKLCRCISIWIPPFLNLQNGCVWGRSIHLWLSFLVLFSKLFWNLTNIDCVIHIDCILLWHYTSRFCLHRTSYMNMFRQIHSSTCILYYSMVLVNVDKFCPCFFQDCDRSIYPEWYWLHFCQFNFLLP